MFDFHEKRKIRSILYSKWGVFLIVLATALLATSVYSRYTAASDMEEKLESRRTALHELEVRAQMLQSKVEYLENERGVEEELRNRFDVAKEGEQVIILLDSKKEKNVGNAPSLEHTDVPKTEKSFFDLVKFW